MTVKVEATCEGSEADQGLGAGEDGSLDTDIDDISNNNSNLINSSQVNATSSSLDSVVQRLIHKSKMGRRKQNCPQRTGNLSEEGKQATN